MSANDKNGGRVPTVRHAYLLGLIGRSYFPARPRWKKVRIECDLIGIMGTPFSHHLQKGN